MNAIYCKILLLFLLAVFVFGRAQTALAIDTDVLIEKPEVLLAIKPSDIAHLLSENKQIYLDSPDYKTGKYIPTPYSTLEASGWTDCLKKQEYSVWPIYGAANVQEATDTNHYDVIIRSDSHSIFLFPISLEKAEEAEAHNIPKNILKFCQLLIKKLNYNYNIPEIVNNNINFLTSSDRYQLHLVLLPSTFIWDDICRTVATAIQGLYGEQKELVEKVIGKATIAISHTLNQ